MRDVDPKCPRRGIDALKANQSRRNERVAPSFMFVVQMRRNWFGTKPDQDITSSNTSPLQWKPFGLSSDHGRSFTRR